MNPLDVEEIKNQIKETIEALQTKEKENSFQTWPVNQWTPYDLEPKLRF